MRAAVASLQHVVEGPVRFKCGECSTFRTSLPLFTLHAVPGDTRFVHEFFVTLTFSEKDWQQGGLEITEATGQPFSDDETNALLSLRVVAADLREWVVDLIEPFQAVMLGVPQGRDGKRHIPRRPLARRGISDPGLRRPPAGGDILAGFRGGIV